MNSIDSDEIIEARIQGESIRSISKRLGCSIEDINDTLDRFAKVTIAANLRVHTLALELERLDKLQRTFERQAEAGDIQSAHLVTKIIERRCIMLGLSAPPRVDPQILEQQAAPKQNSTERIRAAIMRIRALPKPSQDELEAKGSESEAEPISEQTRDTGEDTEPKSH